MIQLIYVSSAASRFDDAALRLLLQRARDNNERLGISGMLVHQNGSFLQVLEGEPPVVDALFWKIGLDQRHGRITLLARNTITARNFADWSMGFVDVRANAHLLPGFRRIGDLTGLQGDSAAIERVISAFRGGRWHHAA